MLLRAHTQTHIERVRTATEDFDADTAALPDIYDHALHGAGAAVAAARAALNGERTFSLMRPPGHHATRDQAMGFCYFNHVAIAALDVLAQGADRVAIWDFDAHHGNGTEDVVRGNERIRFASIHQFPGYPGTGTESFANISNFPVAPYTPRIEHMERMRDALDVLLDFKPDLLIVSAGFDAYARDPLTQMTLLRDDFALLGTWLHQANLNTAAVLEGGYSDDLPELIDTFLTAWERS